MNQLILTIPYKSCLEEELSEQERMLVRKACDATCNSYAPYSNFHVGAAVLLSNGDVVLGSNQENAAFGAGTCAERSALHHAGACYPGESVRAVAVAARGASGAFTQLPVSPCGICRQVLVEMQQRAGQHVQVLLYGASEVWVFDSARDLLPLSFDSIT